MVEGIDVDERAVVVVVVDVVDGTELVVTGVIVVTVVVVLRLVVTLVTVVVMVALVVSGVDVGDEELAVPDDDAATDEDVVVD